MPTAHASPEAPAATAPTPVTTQPQQAASVPAPHPVSAPSPPHGTASGVSRDGGDAPQVPTSAPGQAAGGRPPLAGTEHRPDAQPATIHIPPPRDPLSGMPGIIRVDSVMPLHSGGSDLSSVAERKQQLDMVSEDATAPQVTNTNVFNENATLAIAAESQRPIPATAASEQLAEFITRDNPHEIRKYMKWVVTQPVVQARAKEYLERATFFKRQQDDFQIESAPLLDLSDRLALDYSLNDHVNANAWATRQAGVIQASRKRVARHEAASTMAAAATPQAGSRSATPKSRVVGSSRRGLKPGQADAAADIEAARHTIYSNREMDMQCVMRFTNACVV